MKQWPSYMDGIDRIFGFWPDYNSGYQGIEWTRNTEEEVLEISNEIQTFLNNESKINSSFQWLNANRLPFITIEQPKIGQLDLFTESKYLVLHVKQKLGNKDSNAHFYLFFRDNKSNFGITESKESYTTSEKAIIGRLAKNYAESIVSNFLRSISSTIQFKESTQKLLISKQEENDAQNNDFHKWNNYWLDDYLYSLGKRDGFNYVIHDDARKLLIEKCSNLSQLKKSIEDSFVYICNLSFAEPGDTIELIPVYLIVASLANISDERNININNRISKTVDLLNRLEKSALIVLNTGNSLTSAEVGKNMDRAITAPAISDALKKNKVRILQLLSEYPDQWPTIRKHFKPVVNLFEKNRDNLSSTS
nr:hypothetical protein [uncultured Carboxylicivirga sp.]